MSEKLLVRPEVAVRRERDAFVAGALWLATHSHWFNSGCLPNAAEREAATRYPLPPVRRLRTYMDRDGSVFRWAPKEKVFEMRCQHSEHWWPNPTCYTSDFDALADLKANPWEEVSDE